MEYTMDWETYQLLYKRYLDPDKTKRLLSFVDVKGKMVADLCAGHGRMSEEAVAQGAKTVFAVDLNPTITSFSKCFPQAIPLNKSVQDFLMFMKGTPVKLDVAICQQAVNYWFNSDALDLFEGVVSEGFSLVFNTFNECPSKEIQSINYEIDGRKYEEIFYTSEEPVVGFEVASQTRVHHVQICEGLAPHVTSFIWISPDNIKAILSLYFVDVVEHKIGKTSIFVASQYKEGKRRRSEIFERFSSILKPTIGKQVMPRVKGKPFRCGCGCNVFTEYERLKYECNSCGAAYAGDDVEGSEK